MSGAKFARELRLAFSADKLWPEIAAETATFARRYRDGEIAAGRFSRAYSTFVNGVEDAPEESIRLGGVIVYRANSIGPAVAMALDYLRKNAPDRVVKQGAKHSTSERYRDSFEVGISRGDVAGRAIPAASFNPEMVSADATEAFIYSPLPFSRIVDVQLEGARRIRFSIEPGLFDRAAAFVRRAFPALYAQRVYNLDFPGKYRPKFAKAKQFQSPGVVIRTGR